MNNPPSADVKEQLLKGRLGARFDEALVMASSLHRSQVRKTSGVPYVAHLLGVASLVLEEGGSEDMAIAALLHDAAEDQGGDAVLAEIAAVFGAEVARWVRQASDSSSPSQASVGGAQTPSSGTDSDGRPGSTADHAGRQSTQRPLNTGRPCAGGNRGLGAV